MRRRGKPVNSVQAKTQKNGPRTEKPDGNGALSRHATHTTAFQSRILGPAIQEDGVLVTLDKAIRYLAEPRLLPHLLLLQ